MATPNCDTCKRKLLPGETAWAQEVTVISIGAVRTETLYTCNECEAVAW